MNTSQVKLRMRPLAAAPEPQIPCKYPCGVFLFVFNYNYKILRTERLPEASNTSIAPPGRPSRAPNLM